MTHTPSGTTPQVSLASRAVRAILRSPFGGAAGRALVMVRVRGRNSGKVFEFPVQYATTAGGIVIVPGRPETKQWWRNLREPSPVEVMYRGAWLRARGVVLVDADSLYVRALDDYLARWPEVHVTPRDPLVLVTWLDER